MPRKGPQKGLGPDRHGPGLAIQSIPNPSCLPKKRGKDGDAEGAERGGQGKRNKEEERD